MTVPGLIKDVEAPHLSAPRISILTAATQINENNERWFAGYSFNPEGCAQGGLFDPCAGGNRIEYTGPLDGGIDAPEVKPFVVYTSYRTGTYSLEDGRNIEELFRRADAQLSIVTSFYLEQQLWNDSAGIGNPKLSDAATTVNSVVLTPNQALAELEGAIADCNAGGNMMIHMRPSMLSHILSTGSSAIRRVGNVYLTAMDTIVVPGRGYPGTGPTGDGDAAEAVGQTEWMYASPEVQYRLGKVTHTPDEGSTIERLKEAIDRRSNDITVYAERVASATFDPYCCLLAVEVTRPFTV